MFNSDLKQQIKELRYRLQKVEEPVLGVQYSNGDYMLVPRFNPIDTALSQLTRDNHELRTELKKTKALLNEVIDHVYSKDEN